MGLIIPDVTNSTVVESDGSLRFDGDATVYNDINFPIIPKTTGVGKPTLATFLGNINRYTFAIDDLSEVDSPELLHGWKEGTAVEYHVHWVTNAQDASNRYVKWEVDYTWANMFHSGAPYTFPAATTISAETMIPANTPKYTHFYTSIGSFTPTGGKIGAYVAHSVKRIAASSTAPSANPFGLALGIHYQIDTLGSGSVSSK